MDNDSNLSCAQLYPQDDYKEIAAVRAATGPISIALGALAICINVMKRKYRFQSHLMVLYASVGAVLGGISGSLIRVDYFAQNKFTVAICAAMGFVDTYSTWIIVLSMVALACNLFSDFINNRRGEQRHIRLWSLIVFAFPLTVLWIPFLYLAYGRSPNIPWCAIRTMDDNCTSFAFGQAVSIALSAAISILGSVVIILYVAGVVVLMRRQGQWAAIDPDDAETYRQLKREALVLVLPVTIFTIAYVVRIINEIVEYQYALWILVAICNPTALVVLLLTVDRELCRKTCIEYKEVKHYEVHVKSAHEIEVADNDDGFVTEESVCRSKLSYRTFYSGANYPPTE